LKPIFILRLGHRVGRDERVSTHCGLVARAFGAQGIIFTGDRDQDLLESLKKVVAAWGGTFSVRHDRRWRRVVDEWKSGGGFLVHATMYGVNLPEAVGELRRVAEQRSLLIAVGSGKVPRELYEAADMNVAVSNQPHSEVAAISTILDWVFQGRELEAVFDGATRKVLPTPRAKRVAKAPGQAP